MFKSAVSWKMDSFPEMRGVDKEELKGLEVSGKFSFPLPPPIPNILSLDQLRPYLWGRASYLVVAMETVLAELEPQRASCLD